MKEKSIHLVFAREESIEKEASWLLFQTARESAGRVQGLLKKLKKDLPSTVQPTDVRADTAKYRFISVRPSNLFFVFFLHQQEEGIEENQ